MRGYTNELTLSTPYGEATFGLEITQEGQVIVSALPLAGLPDSVFKLTYGHDWEEAQEYFQDLGTTLPYRIGAALFAADSLAELHALVWSFRETYPEAAPGTPYSVFWRDHAEWITLFSLNEQQLTAALDRFRQRAHHQDLAVFGSYLLPYFLRLFPVATHRTTVLLYAALGALGTEPARDYLLSELESEGRHPFTAKILQALIGFEDADTAARLFAVYTAGKFDVEGLEAHLKTVSRFGATQAGNHVEIILADHPEQVALVVAALLALDYSAARTAGLVRQAFEGPQQYRDLDRLLRATNGLGRAESYVDLAAMNARAEEPAFLELPPVNWPQQLEEGWADLVLTTLPSAALQVIGDYLLRPEPRLQRNALLQLKALLQKHPPQAPLHPAIEDRLRQLVASRFDKVSVEVLNVLGRRELPLHDRAATLDAVLGVSIGSRYRFVVLTALRRIGNTPELKARARRYLVEQIEGAGDPNRREQIASLLPFVEKYLGDVASLRQQLADGGTAS